MRDIAEKLQIDNPDQRMINNMLVMEMYLDAVFDANPEVSRPNSDRRCWGVVACLVAAGKAPSIHTWALAAQIDVIGGPDLTKDDEKLPPGSVITMKDGTKVVVNEPILRPDDAADVERALKGLDG